MVNKAYDYLVAAVCMSTQLVSDSLILGEASHSNYPTVEDKINQIMKEKYMFDSYPFRIILISAEHRIVYWKRGKMQMTKSQLSLVLNVIGSKRVARVFVYIQMKIALKISTSKQSTNFSPKPFLVSICIASEASYDYNNHSDFNYVVDDTCLTEK